MTKQKKDERPVVAPPTVPILIKRDAETEWHEDERLFYLLARGGLYRCRQTEFFRSCVPAPGGPRKRRRLFVGSE